MSEYIDREKTVKALDKLCDRICQYSKKQRKFMCGACPLGDAFTVIEDDLPAADVVPVRHGHWDNKRVAFFSKCSECGCCVKTPNEIESVFLDFGELNYCPNCGADMRG